MNNIDRLSNILDHFFKEDVVSKLQEKQEDMQIDFITDNKRFLSFSFDKQPLPSKDFPKGLFPFFNKGESKVNSFCDYIIFTENSGNLFVLLIELKSGKNNVTKQLDAGKCFADFIVSTLNRVYNLNVTPQIRKISIRKGNIKNKPQRKTRIKYVDDFHTFCDQKFWLKKYLE